MQPDKVGKWLNDCFRDASRAVFMEWAEDNQIDLDTYEDDKDSDKKEDEITQAYEASAVFSEIKIWMHELGKDVGSSELSWAYLQRKTRT